MIAAITWLFNGVGHTYVVKSLLLIKSLVTSELSLNRFEGQYVPITSQISKENFEVIKRVEIKRVCTFSVLQDFRIQTHFSCRVGLSW